MKSRIVALTLVLFALLLFACSGQATSDDEELISLVEKFQTARNEGNWDLAASYLAEDVVWETPSGNSVGRDAWLSSVGIVPGIFEDVQNSRVEGNTVFVEMIVTGPDFASPAMAEVVVEDGKIQRYTVTPP